MGSVKTVTHVNNKILLFVLMLMFLLGNLLGTIIFFAVKCNEFTELDSMIKMFFYNRLECTFMQTVINSFSGTFILIAICAILGLGAFFQPIEFIVPLFHGLGIGILLSGLYYNYGIHGMIVAGILVIPHYIMSSFVIIVAAREAVRMSNAMCVSVLNNSDHIKIDLNLYMTKYIILLLITAFLAIADSFTAYLGTELWAGLSVVKK